MLDQKKLPAMKLKVKDAFSMIDVIKVLEEWLKENYYVDLDGGEDFETVYTHALRAGGSFLDAWLWWRAVRYPRGTTSKTSFVRYRISIDMHFLGDAAETEVLNKGKKVKLNKGECEFTITPVLEIDFRNEWGDKGLKGLISEVFKKRIYKKEIDAHVEAILTDTARIQNMLKQFFKLESTMAEETVSQPPKGLM